MSLKLYMDENVPRQISLGLRLRGVDVITVQEDNRTGWADPKILERSTELNRVLFSRDDDLLVIAHRLQEEKVFFSGAIYCHPQAVSIGDCVRDLELIAKACEMEDCQSQVQFLPL